MNRLQSLFDWQLPLLRKFGAQRRRVTAGDTSLTITLSGWSKIAALASKMTFEYVNVVDVSVKSAPSMSVFTPRLGWLNPVTGARAGRFRPKGSHYFVSFDRPDHKLLHLKLIAKDVTKFDTVYIEVDDVEAVRDTIANKLLQMRKTS